MQCKMNEKTLRNKVKFNFRWTGRWKVQLFLSENCVEHQDFIIDSGATDYLIKNKKLFFANLDETFSGIIHNVNETRSSI